MSVEEATKRWKRLLEMEALTPTSCFATSAASATTGTKRKRSVWTSTSESNNENDDSDNVQGNEVEEKEEEDPFDCKSVAVPPTYDLAERTIQDYLIRWKQLEDRKVRQNPSETTARITAAATTTTTTTTVATAAPAAPGAVPTIASPAPAPTSPEGGSAPPAASINEDEMNVQGDHPSPSVEIATRRNIAGWRNKEGRLLLPEQFDYRTRRSDPPPDDENSGGDRVISLVNPNETLSYHRELWKLFATIPRRQELENQAREGHEVHNTLKVYEEVNALKNTSTADYHALLRLRMPDRHGLPPLTVFGQPSNDPKNKHELPPTTATVRMEFWRRQPKRMTTPDCNRMILEFLESQTLFDVHMAVSKMLEDELWESGRKLKDKDGNTGDDVDGGTSGCFFIEDTFYTTGTVDYASPIVEWLDGYTGQPNPTRRRHLGIATMKDLKKH